MSSFNSFRANFLGVCGRVISGSLALPKRAIASGSFSISSLVESFVICRFWMMPISVKVSGISLGRLTIKIVGVLYFMWISSISFKSSARVCTSKASKGVSKITRFGFEQSALANRTLRPSPPESWRIGLSNNFSRCMPAIASFKTSGSVLAKSLLGVMPKASSSEALSLLRIL